MLGAANIAIVSINCNKIQFIFFVAYKGWFVLSSQTAQASTKY